MCEEKKGVVSTQHTSSWPNPRDRTRFDERTDRVTVGIVMPAYQAAQSVARVVRDFAARADWVIIVDDASSDDTSAQARDLHLPNVVVVQHEYNRGVGGAMKTGIAAAQERGVSIIVKVDADGQMDPGHLDKLLEPLLRGKADVTKGNRWGDRVALRDMPWARRCGNVGLAFLTRLASGHWRIFDPTNGYIAWRTDLLRKLDFSLVPDRYTF